MRPGTIERPLTRKELLAAIRSPARIEIRREKQQAKDEKWIARVRDRVNAAAMHNGEKSG